MHAFREEAARTRELLGRIPATGGPQSVNPDASAPASVAAETGRLKNVRRVLPRIPLLSSTLPFHLRSYKGLMGATGAGSGSVMGNRSNP
jgi:hypothetical protein